MVLLLRPLGPPSGPESSSFRSMWCDPILGPTALRLADVARAAERAAPLAEPMDVGRAAERVRTALVAAADAGEAGVAFGVGEGGPDVGSAHAAPAHTNTPQQVDTSTAAHAPPPHEPSVARAAHLRPCAAA